MDHAELEWNFIAMSESGKPIWTRQESRNQDARGGEEGDDEQHAGVPAMSEAELSRVCGLVQALRTSILCSKSSSETASSSSSLGLGDIQSLQSEFCTLVFVSIGSITLLAVAKHGATTATEENSVCLMSEKEAFLRLQLEFIYAQIIFCVTEQVQDTFVQNPSFDLRNYLGAASDRVIRNVVQHGLPGQDDDEPGAFLSMGVETVYPLSPTSRDKVSNVLLRLMSSVKANNKDDTAPLYALLLSGTKLVSLVQPNFRPHQLRAPDLQLLLHFVARQMENNHQHPQQSSATTRTTTDLWLPVCLPHVHAGGFVYCYTHALLTGANGDGTATTASSNRNPPLLLALLSSDGSSEQFECFRLMARQVRSDLGFGAIAADPPVLELAPLGSSASNDNVGNVPPAHHDDDEPLGEEQVQHDHHHHNEEDYVDASGDADRMIPYIPDEREKREKQQLFEELCMCASLENDGTFQEVQEELLKEYLALANAWHFLFRLDAPISAPPPSERDRRSNSSNANPSGHLTQCLFSRVDHRTRDRRRRSLLWRIYQRLNLKLRLGSATYEASADAFDMIQQDHRDEHKNKRKHQQQQHPSIGKDCAATGLLEAPPNLDGVTYMKVGDDMFLAMSGHNFELYLAADGSVPAEKVAGAAAKLARRLLQDQASLFLCSPQTWPQ